MSKMYSSRKMNIAVWRGCSHNCTYCAFRHSLARSKCEQCRRYEPHFHPESFRRPPKTGPGEFVSIGMNGDIAFAPFPVLTEMVRYCQDWPKTTFFMQTKCPAVFIVLEGAFRLPENLILGTTLETNRDTPLFSKAPPPLVRAEIMSRLRHRRRAITIEPIMDFDLDNFTALIKSIEPERVWVGYNSRPECRLPEPPLVKTHALVVRLLEFTKVELKLLREREKVSEDD